ncbi:MAG TPA: 23S rRNA (uracil(1939)-C(5))-methyltransferase RlmD [Eubacteriales bacterium]|nr:23S rRNA (uracil(1939)-C(5))-methyltransferase RlmD [Eubacteriales bacterium]
MAQYSKTPVSKNDDLTLQVTALTNEGQGVARVENFAVFVPGALPGETVSAHIIKVTASYAVAKILDFVTVSPDRTDPGCPVYAQCGGCTLRHLHYAAQLEQKRLWVGDALSRLGGFSDVSVQPVAGMETPSRYRNKGSFPFGTAGNAVVFGFYAARSHVLVPLADCPIQDERVVECAERVCAWANECRIPVYDEKTGKGQLRHVVVRTNADGARMVTVVTRGPLRRRDELFGLLGDCESVWHNENPKNTNVIFGELFTLLFGKPALIETIGDKRFSVGPQSFLQVNRKQTQVLYEAAASLLAAEPDETIVDAYCGVGTISLFLAGGCKQVIGVEQVAAAVEDAERNAVLNGVTNASFITGEVESVLPRLVAEQTKIDALVLDPPRKGCGEAALKAIAQSGANRVVYVSCNPATLARDCKFLAGRGFSLAAVQPVDMFPHTCHVETVCLLVKNSRS